MADQVQTPESGGGEGAPTVQPVVAETSKTEIAAEQSKYQVSAEIKPEEPKQQDVKENSAKAPKEVKTEALTETKSEQSLDAKIEKPSEVPSQQLKEVKPEDQKEIKSAPPEVTPEIPAPINTAPEATPGEPNNSGDVKVEANGVKENTSPANQQGDWQQRESELLKKIEELEKVKAARTQDSILLELKVRDEEIDLLKARVKNLETELQAALSKPSGKNHEMIEKIKQQHEELLSKARGMIFDKTKMVKNQELQIEALTTQIQSLKDINQITKDLLEIRNSEVKAMEDRLQAMEARFKAEKDRYGLVLERAQTSSNINDDLRKEYETQLKLFKELREKYDQRVQALVAENERLKASLNPGGGAPSTTG